MNKTRGRLEFEGAVNRLAQAMEECPLDAPVSRFIANGKAYCITTKSEAVDNKQMIDASDKRLRFIPLEKATTPQNGLVHCILNAWWAVHPDKGIIFYRPSGKGTGSPQCNTNQNISAWLAVMYPWARVERIPMVMYPIDPHDYC